MLVPTDGAFGKLSPGEMGSLFYNTPEMKSVMEKYIIKGRYTADQLVKMGSITTVSGMKLAVKRRPDGSVMIGEAKVVRPDLQASNGIIQGIDRVMLVPY